MGTGRSADSWEGGGPAAERLAHPTKAQLPTRAHPPRLPPSMAPLIGHSLMVSMLTVAILTLGP